MDPLYGPSAIAIGNSGELRIAGLKAGALTKWRLVTSPMAKREDGTPYLTLFGEGTFLRFFKQATGAGATVHLVPVAPPYRIGRPKPKAAKPFTLKGKVFELSAGRITISEAEFTAHG